jgi:hypothetical protein
MRERKAKAMAKSHLVDYEKQSPLCGQRLGWRSEIAWVSHDPKTVECEKCRKLFAAKHAAEQKE